MMTTNSPLRKQGVALANQTLQYGCTPSASAEGYWRAIVDLRWVDHRTDPEVVSLTELRSGPNVPTLLARRVIPPFFFPG